MNYKIHDATQTFRRQLRRDPPGPTAVSKEGNKFSQKHTLELRCGLGAYKILYHGWIAVGDAVVEVATFAHEGP